MLRLRHTLRNTRKYVGPRRSGDVVQIYSACDKAKNILGWTAERDLDNCTATAWKWEQAIAHK